MHGASFFFAKRGWGPRPTQSGPQRKSHQSFAYRELAERVIIVIVTVIQSYYHVDANGNVWRCWLCCPYTPPDTRWGVWRAEHVRQVKRTFFGACVELTKSFPLDFSRPFSCCFDVYVPVEGTEDWNPAGTAPVAAPKEGLLTTGSSCFFFFFNSEYQLIRRPSRTIESSEPR